MKKWLFLLLLSVQTWAFAQESNKLDLLDIFHLEFVSDPQISPDGNKILYVRNFKDIMTDKNHSNIWVINFDGTGNQPITTGNHSDNMPRWTPDGKRIVYRSNKDGKNQLYLFWLESRAEQQITNLAGSPSNISVSPDGKKLVFSMFVEKKKHNPIKMPQAPAGAKWNTPPAYTDEINYKSDGQGYLKEGKSQLFIMDLEGGTHRQMTDASNHLGQAEWSKDGKYVYVSANLSENGDLNPLNSEIYRIDISTGSFSALTDRNGPDANPKVSPDGQSIAYLGFDDKLMGYHNAMIYVMDVNGKNQKILTEKLDRSIDQLFWDEKGTGLFFQYDDTGNTKIGYVDLKGKTREVVSNVGGLSLGRPYTAGQFTVGTAGKYAFTLGSSERPAELGVGVNGSSARITDVNSDILGVKKPGKVEEIRWKSSFDKKEIQGWIVYPPDFDPSQKYPLMLEIHGGPFAAYSSFFSIETQLYASAGYVVLYCNPRGSTSYGKDFANLIHHNYPSQDYDDLMSGVDAVIAKGFIDQRNLFVTGGSGGGVLTSWIIGKTDRFRAAVIAKPVINWYSHVLYADAPAFFAKYWFGKNPWEDTEAYMKRSPISLVGNVKTPAMLLTGTDDERTPLGESEQYYAALKMQGKEAALVRVFNASHDIAEIPSNLVGKVAAILSWFDQYKVQDTPPPTTLDKK